MDDLGEAASVLSAIRDGSRAWSTASEITALVEHDQVEHQLVILMGMDLVASWMRGDELVYTLTPLAASGLRVELAERGLCGRLYWASKRRSKRVRHPKLGELVPDPLPDIVDPQPTPEEAAELSEHARAWKPRGAFKVDRLPKPTHLLYYDGNPWMEPVPQRAKILQCGTCHDRALALSEYCLTCHRWGFDGVIAKQKRLAKKRA